MGRWIESIVALLPIRLALAGVFGFAAVMKLADPQAFGFAVKAFKLVDPEQGGHVLMMLTYGVPWAELIAALLLIVGFWTRGAASLLGLLLLMFIGGQISLITRGISTECACFGDAELFCQGPVGWCHIVRNAVFLLLTLVLIWRGGGLASLDHRLNRAGKPAGSADPVDLVADEA